VNSDDKKRVVPQSISDFFVRYGAGAHALQQIAKGKAWNVISWVLIGIGVAGWVVFLMWQP
jgi:hypothetical protein